MASNITMVCTSCNRHDLLRQSLDSFIECTDMQPQETIIVEDGPTPRPDWLLHPPYRTQLGTITWLQNEKRRGQIYSIDKAYAQIHTDYIFHAEDDWLYTESNFMAPSKAILDKYPEIVTVSLRGTDCNGHPLVNGLYPFAIQEPQWKGGWGAFNFNPGLRRLSDYKKIGSYGRHTAYGTSGLLHELALSRLYYSLNYRIAVLPQIYVTHTGGGRSRAIEPLDPLPRILIAIPACHKFDYGKWESADSPLYNPATAYNNQPYGQDIHISGPNPRIAAVRETWAKDVIPFAAHVTLRFFYGQPHPPTHAPDDVHLRCGDTYADLPDKTLAICKWALDPEHDFDYMAKFDDDSFVWIDRLVREILTEQPDYGGYQNGNVCSGGPGYILSRKAMQEVVRNPFTGATWAEDCMIGKVMHAAGINPQMLPNHHPGFSAHWFWPNGFDSKTIPIDAVCVHAVQPDVMKQLYIHERGLP